MKKVRRFLSFLLSICMMLSLATPIVANAETVLTKQSIDLILYSDYGDWSFNGVLFADEVQAGSEFTIQLFLRNESITYSYDLGLLNDEKQTWYDSDDEIVNYIEPDSTVKCYKTITVTEEDIEAGKICRNYLVSNMIKYEDSRRVTEYYYYISYNPTIELVNNSYSDVEDNTSMDIDVVEENSSINKTVVVGDTVEAEIKITNTGSYALVPAYYKTYLDDTKKILDEKACFDADNWFDYEGGLDYNESATGKVSIKVTNKDINAGSVVRYLLVGSYVRPPKNYEKIYIYLTTIDDMRMFTQVKCETSLIRIEIPIQRKEYDIDFTMPNDGVTVFCWSKYDDDDECMIYREIQDGDIGKVYLNVENPGNNDFELETVTYSYEGSDENNVVSEWFYYNQEKLEDPACTRFDAREYVSNLFSKNSDNYDNIDYLLCTVPIVFTNADIDAGYKDVCATLVYYPIEKVNNDEKVTFVHKKSDGEDIRLQKDITFRVNIRKMEVSELNSQMRWMYELNKTDISIPCDAKVGDKVTVSIKAMNSSEMYDLSLFSNEVYTYDEKEGYVLTNENAISYWSNIELESTDDDSTRFKLNSNIVTDFEFEITEEDIQRGSVDRYLNGYAYAYTDSNKDLVFSYILESEDNEIIPYDNQNEQHTKVSIPILNPETKDVRFYTDADNAALVDAKAGDTVVVSTYAVNDSNTPYQLDRIDVSSDNPDDISSASKWYYYDDDILSETSSIEEAKSYDCILKPDRNDCSFNDISVVVTEDDISRGYLERKINVEYYPLELKTGPTESDTRYDWKIDEYGRKVKHDKTFTLKLIIVNDTTSEDITKNISWEYTLVKSGGVTPATKVGDKVKATIQIKNTSDYDISLNEIGVLVLAEEGYDYTSEGVAGPWKIYKDGTAVEASEADAHFKKGTSIINDYEFEVTEADIEAGKIVRYITNAAVVYQDVDKEIIYNYSDKEKDDTGFASNKLIRNRIEPEDYYKVEIDLSCDASVKYRTHIQSIGWQSMVSDGAMSGTYGKAKRLEGIEISVDGVEGLGIVYTTHCQSYGWLPWSANGEMNGTESEAKRLEAIMIKLTGDKAQYYDVYYRVHAQSFGWLGWAKNGEPSGTAGYGKRLEAIQIVVVKKGEDIPKTLVPGLVYNDPDGKLDAFYAKAGSSPIVGYPATTNTNPVVPGDDVTSVAVRTHVQSLGWQGWKFNGQMSGTSGMAKRLEAISIKLQNVQCSGGITYRTHVQTYGWQSWKSNGAMAGTSGEAKRLEAIEIKLTGEMAEKYDVYYRVHAQSFGWLGWAKNGESSGTAGGGLRLEAIQVVLVPKGEKAPATNYGGISSVKTASFVKVK